MRKGRLNYAETNEDLKIITKALEFTPQTCLTGIGASGDVGFEALAYGAKNVLLFDNNYTQVAYTYLRKAAFLSLSQGDNLFFLGFNGGFEKKRRGEMFITLIPSLPEEYQQFWRQRISLIYAGLVNQSTFAKRILGQKKRLKGIVGERGGFEVLIGKRGSKEERKAIFEKHKREIFKIFPNDLRRWAEKLILQGEVNSPVVARFFLGFTPQKFLPHFLTPRGYQAVRSSLGEGLEISDQELLEGLSELKRGSFNTFYFSNIIDYQAQNWNWIETLVKTLKRICPKKGRVLLFNRNSAIKKQVTKMGGLLRTAGFCSLSEGEELKRKEKVGTLEKLLLFERKT